MKTQLHIQFHKVFHVNSDKSTIMLEDKDYFFLRKINRTNRHVTSRCYLSMLMPVQHILTQYTNANMQSLPIKQFSSQYIISSVYNLVF